MTADIIHSFGAFSKTVRTPVELCLKQNKSETTQNTFYIPILQNPILSLKAIFKVIKHVSLCCLSTYLDLHTHTHT